MHLLMCALMNRHTLQLALVWWCFFIIINNDIVIFQLSIIQYHEYCTIHDELCNDCQYVGYTSISATYIASYPSGVCTRIIREYSYCCAL